MAESSVERLHVPIQRQGLFGAADLLRPVETGAGVFFDDPVAFCEECVGWEDGDGLTRYQARNMGLLVREKRLAVRAPHGAGKSTTTALLVLWFALTRDARGCDWKCITTASAWRQLEKYLWPEIHKWARKLNWEKLGRAPFSRQELLALSLKLTFGEAFAVACEDPAKIEGAHADELFFLFDESKAIPAPTFDAAEGAFSGAGGDTRHHALALASSTPGATNGRFWEIHQRKPGLEDWHTVHVTLKDVVEAGRVSEQWANQRARQWGRDSAVFANRVLGEFANSDEDGVIPLSWIEAAIERWENLAPQDDETDPLSVIGVDVARSGADKTVIALRFGNTIREIRRFDRQGTMETAGRVLGILDSRFHPARDCAVVIDVIGIGAGVVDRVREQARWGRVIAFNASERSRKRDRTNELGMINSRAAAWWTLREMLDPDSGCDVALPNDDELIGDLTAPTWKITSGGKIQIESKDDIRRRIGRSTDAGDAVVQAYFTESGAQPLKSFLAADDFSFFAATPSVSQWPASGLVPGGLKIGF